MKMGRTGAVHQDRLKAINKISGIIHGWSWETETNLDQNSPFARRVSGDHDEHEDHRVSWTGYCLGHGGSFTDGGCLGDMHGMSDSLCASGIDALSDVGMSSNAM